MFQTFYLRYQRISYSKFNDYRRKNVSAIFSLSLNLTVCHKKEGNENEERRDGEESLFFVLVRKLHASASPSSGDIVTESTPVNCL